VVELDLPGGAMRVLVASVSAIAGILLFLLASASSKTSLFAKNYQLLLGLNGAIALLLLLLVLFQIHRVWREYREHQFGSRLKLKLLGLLTLMAVVPCVLIYGVSLQFATRSIDFVHGTPRATTLRCGPISLLTAVLVCSIYWSRWIG